MCWKRGRNDVHKMHMAKTSRTRTKRPKRLHMLLSREEWDMLLELCDDVGLTASDMVRQLIRREHKRVDAGDDD